RSANMFMIFRSEFVAKEKKAAPGSSLRQGQLSTRAGELWRKMSENEKRPYKKRADEEAAAH
ncbi:hypothetical protein BV20DRAFT_913754, partial [Pilatotrama ljubarskyi]